VPERVDLGQDFSAQSSKSIRGVARCPPLDGIICQSAPDYVPDSLEMLQVIAPDTEAVRAWADAFDIDLDTPAAGNGACPHVGLVNDGQGAADCPLRKQPAGPLARRIQEVLEACAAAAAAANVATQAQRLTREIAIFGGSDLEFARWQTLSLSRHAVELLVHAWRQCKLLSASIGRQATDGASDV
jgi:hypothetical protein